MTARIMDGKRIAQEIRAEVAAEVARLKAVQGITPGLAAVLVGDNPASEVYVRNKRRACEEIGINSRLHRLPTTTREEELLELISRLNHDPATHGILVQLPLPTQIEESRILAAVDPLKDVDGFSAENVGLMVQGRPRFLPCTPHGVQQLLVRSGVQIEGAHVVVVGRSGIVGKPLAIMLMQKAKHANATVTVCHTGTRDIGPITRTVDIVVVAIGKPRFLTAEMVRPGAVVIDVGVNREAGRLVGDVDFEPVKEVASAISPVPGGVGPMTIAMLLHNTALAARLQHNVPNKS